MNKIESLQNQIKVNQTVMQAMEIIAENAGVNIDEFRKKVHRLSLDMIREKRETNT